MPQKTRTLARTNAAMSISSQRAMLRTTTLVEQPRQRPGARKRERVCPKAASTSEPLVRRRRLLSPGPQGPLCRDGPARPRCSELGRTLEIEGALEPCTGSRPVRKRVATEDDGSSDESSDGEEAETEGASGQAEKRRARRRVTRHLTEALGLSGEPVSFLEAKSISAQTLRSYRLALVRFMTFAGLGLRARPLRHTGDEIVDESLVRFFTKEYFSGGHPSRGERTMAGLMMLEPSFSTSGHQKLPRAWRALRGWRRLTPTVTRKPMPWPFWCGVATLLAKKHHLGMGVFVLLSVSGYFRPSELLSVRRCDIFAPSPGVLEHWSILLFPEHLGKPSKTMQFGDSVEMDDPRVSFLSPVLATMSSEKDERSAWSFAYPDYLQAFKRVVGEMGYPNGVPYQARHSGPSTDLADGTRSLAEAQRRGRWAQARSMARYERRARLAAEWMKLPARTRTMCQVAVIQLEATFRNLCRGRNDAVIEV